MGLLNFRAALGSGEGGIGFSLGKFARRLGAGNGHEHQPSEADLVANYKREALGRAKELATTRGHDAKATMTDYYIAALELGERHQETMREQGIQWNPKVFADLSGQRIESFQINKSEMEPGREVILMAQLRAAETAKSLGNKANLKDILREVQRIQTSGEKIEGTTESVASLQQGVEGLRNSLDLDGDGVAFDFYSAVRNQSNFKGTVFDNVNFHPAGTLMRNGENGVALTEGASFNNATFDGMTANDQVAFVGREFHDVKFTNIKGGSITIPDGTQVDGMDISGAEAELHIGRAAVSRLDASNARILKFDAAPGAVISNSSFEGTTIDMGSVLQGATLQHVGFSQANLVDVNFKGANLSHVTFDQATMKGTSFDGANLSHVAFKDVDAGTLDLSKVAKFEDVTIDGRTYHNKEEYHMSQQIAQAGVQSFAWKPEMRTQAATPEAPQQAAAAITTSPAPSEPSLPSTISGGVSVSLNDVGLTTAVAELKRTVEPQTGFSMAPRKG